MVSNGKNSTEKLYFYRMTGVIPAIPSSRAKS